MVRDSLPFRRTDKGGNAKRGSDNPALWETALGVLLALSAIILMVINTTDVVEMTLFASTLLVQSLPFLAAALMVAIERYQTRMVTRHRPAVVLPALAPARSDMS